MAKSEIAPENTKIEIKILLAIVPWWVPKPVGGSGYTTVADKSFWTHPLAETGRKEEALATKVHYGPTSPNARGPVGPDEVACPCDKSVGSF